MLVVVVVVIMIVLLVAGGDRRSRSRKGHDKTRRNVRKECEKKKARHP
jgi:FtsZ-interacting cell division protein ZipA